jgi:hypothetical protein
MRPPGLKPLDAAEIRSFVRDGFLIKRGVLDPAACARARDALWAHNVVPRLRRDDPASWVGPWPYGEEDWRPGTATPGGTRKHYRWLLGAVGADPLFVELVGGAAFAFAEQLLGEGEATAPRAAGGVHCTLPAGRARRRGGYRAHAIECHVDQTLDSRERLGVVGYIADVWPGCGAFGVWAGSHHRVNGLQRDAAAAAAAPARDDLRGVQMPAYGPRMTPELERLVREVAPTDCWGRAGDVVLYHARLAHSPLRNHGAAIRQAVITGFGKTAAALPDAELLAHVAEGDIWREWSAEVRAAAAAAGGAWRAGASAGAHHRQAPRL